MVEMDAAAVTAGRRSLDADLASDAAAAAVTADANLHAIELHREAASWWRRASNEKMAERHDTWAKVHAQLAARLADTDS